MSADDDVTRRTRLAALRSPRSRWSQRRWRSARWRSSSRSPETAPAVAREQHGQVREHAPEVAKRAGHDPGGGAVPGSHEPARYRQTPHGDRRYDQDHGAGRLARARRGRGPQRRARERASQRRRRARPRAAHPRLSQGQGAGRGRPAPGRPRGRHGRGGPARPAGLVRAGGHRRRHQRSTRSATPSST
jgi:hypothetical protein